MLQDLFLVFFYYGIGWVGAYLLFMTVLYALATIKTFTRTSNDHSPNNKWLSFIKKAYDWFDIDFMSDDVENSYIPIKAMFVLAAYACLGPYALITSLIIAVLAYITLSIWSSLKNK